MPERSPFRFLIDAGLTGSQNTVKQIVPTRPDLIIRSNSEGESYSLDDAKQLQSEFDLLEKDYGIKIPLVNVVLGQGLAESELFIVVERVNGENLEEAFKHPTPDLIDKYQAVCICLSRYMVDKVSPKKPYLMDITSLSNFVYGTLHHDTEPEIYLIDLEYSFTDFQFSTEECSNYHLWLGWFSCIIDNVIEAEQIGKIQLPKVRKELKAILDNPPDTNFNPKALSYLKNLLKFNKILDIAYFDEHFENYNTKRLI